MAVQAFTQDLSTNFLFLDTQSSVGVLKLVRKITHTRTRTVEGQDSGDEFGEGWVDSFEQRNF